jgi:hypothetical protein
LGPSILYLFLPFVVGCFVLLMIGRVFIILNARTRGAHEGYGRCLLVLRNLGNICSQLTSWERVIF